MVAGPLLGRIKCHCTTCQSANQAAFADSTVLMAKQVPLDRVEHVRFEARKKRPAAQRGFCRSCGCFVLARMTVLPFLSLAFVPAARFHRAAVVAFRKLLTEPEIRGKLGQMGFNVNRS